MPGGFSKKAGREHPLEGRAWWQPQRAREGKRFKEDGRSGWSNPAVGWDKIDWGCISVPNTEIWECLMGVHFGGTVGGTWSMWEWGTMEHGKEEFAAVNKDNIFRKWHSGWKGMCVVVSVVCSLTSAPLESLAMQHLSRLTGLVVIRWVSLAIALGLTKFLVTEDIKPNHWTSELWKGGYTANGIKVYWKELWVR